MLDSALLERVTRTLALMLRHQPELFDLELDSLGFGDVEEVLQALEERLGVHIEAADLEEALLTGERVRYEIVAGRIRALYGHSIAIEAGPASKPPERLYVGLSLEDAERALRHGLRGGRRRFLHLSTTPEEAAEAARRSGRHWAVLAVRSIEGWEEGVNFFDRRVLWLTEELPGPLLLEHTQGDDGQEPRPLGADGRPARSHDRRGHEAHGHAAGDGGRHGRNRHPHGRQDRERQGQFRHAERGAAEGYAPQHAGAESQAPAPYESTAPDASSEAYGPDGDSAFEAGVGGASAAEVPAGERTLPSESRPVEGEERTRRRGRRGRGRGRGQGEARGGEAGAHDPRAHDARAHEPRHAGAPPADSRGGEQRGGGYAGQRGPDPRRSDTRPYESAHAPQREPRTESAPEVRREPRAAPERPRDRFEGREAVASTPAPAAVPARITPPPAVPAGDFGLGIFEMPAATPRGHGGAPSAPREEPARPAPAREPISDAKATDDGAGFGAGI
jgi:putative RNA 2'-phosphotransferase